MLHGSADEARDREARPGQRLAVRPRRQSAIRQLTDDPTNAKLKADLTKCDKAHKAALDALRAQYDAGAAVLDQEAYDSKVRAPAMILTDDLWLPRAMKLRPLTSKGWNKIGAWTLGNHPALVFEINTLAQFNAFLAKERVANQLMILFRRRVMAIQVAGDWKTLPELAMMVNARGAKVRIGNVLILGADDDARDPNLEQGLLGAFHTELIAIYVFDEPGMIRQRTAAVDKVLADAKKVLDQIKKDAAKASIGANETPRSSPPTPRSPASSAMRPSPRSSRSAAV